MKKLIILSGLLALWATNGYGQGLISNTINGKPYPAYYSEPTTVAQLIEDRKQQKAVFQELELLAFDPARQRNDYQDVVSEAVFLELDQEALGRFQAAPSRDIQFVIPVSSQKQIVLELTQVNVVSDGFMAVTSSGRAQRIGPSGIFYHGIVAGVPGSKVAASIFQGKVRVLISDQGGTYVLGRLPQSQDSYILFNEKNLHEKEPGWFCDTPDYPLPKVQSPESRIQRSVVSHCVKVYVETEFELYLDLGSSLDNVVDYVLSLFNEVILAYEEIDVPMEVSQVFVWDQPDPYSDEPEDVTSFEILNDFVANRPIFNGDLAHLLTTRNGLGGLALGIGGICGNGSDPGPYCMSGGLEAVNPANLPSISSTFVRVAHEMGHVLGSRHTHACVWGANHDTQIDDCGSVWFTENGMDDDNDGIVDEIDEAEEGAGCFNPDSPIDPSTPNGSGTIMSYCHLTDSGRDLYNGFGPEPANVIRSTVMNATCLSDQCSCGEFANRTINGMPIPSGVYTASNSITSSGDADASVNNVVIFRAGNWIELTPGFEAEELFIAEVVDTLCDDGVSPLQGAFTLREVDGNKLIAEPPVTDQLVVWPNPAAEVLNLEYTIAEEGKVSLVILNTYGQVVERIEENNFLPAGDYRREVPLYHWPAGSYFVALQSPDGRLVQPFLLIKR